MTKLISTNISEEMKQAYLDYAMSVIVARALPDVRDGLKPVHRRILYAMHKLGLSSTSRYSKSAKVVGEVLGKYHPHGDIPVYDALVRMAQDFSMRYPLVRGQGNFGSIDGDPPAAMRYTEVKLTKIAEEMLIDIEKETVEFADNFDATLKEPVFLPAKLPNILLMGTEGIAVGMATKIPPHNLVEVVDALCLMLDKAKTVKISEDQPRSENNNDLIKVNEKLIKLTSTDLSDSTDPPNRRADLNQFKPISTDLRFDVPLEEILEFIKGPDFPTAGTIYGFKDIREAYATGRGKILIRAKIVDEDIGKGRTAIIVKELPYQVNKADLVSKIAHLAVSKKIDGISDLRDESDRDGIRIVIELKRDAAYKKVLNNLYKYTELQTTFPMNTVALVEGIPQTLSLKSILEYYIKHRVRIVTRRSKFELKEAKAKAHILEGYLIALDNIDAVVSIIRKSRTESEAKEKLMQKFKLSAIQSQAILDMQLKRLTGLERTRIEDELKMLKETIDYLEALLKDVFKILKVIKNEIIYLKEKYGDARKTKVVKAKPGEITDEELIENKEVIVVLTKEGYIKQVPRETFRVQNRGGKGVSGIETKESDNVYYITTAMTHDHMLFFTNQGRVFKTRVWDVPIGTRIAKGKAIVNLLTLRPQEKITSVLTYDLSQIDQEKAAILMATKKGIVKKTPFKEFENLRTNGIIAIRLETNDELLWVKLTNGSKNVIMVSRSGKAIIFKETEIRPTGRASRGVKGIEITGDNELAAADVFDDQEFKKDLFVICERGIGKKTKLSFLKGQHRGGKGVKIQALNVKLGRLAFAKIISAKDSTVIITSILGQIVKIPLHSIPKRSRTAKGVILMRFSDVHDKVASATFV